ncbi:hypothetical protein Y032_0099g3182 [Ancylostoma ceylanicum]|uniref:CHK kinase-like domain-containing protein n=1 Tax=Ancylostoma ceylanicum TaxID=53326 RepID=A0A016TJ46_9BILA|nr:hypothetical protein Y032_0099g3182 [Ancylostoma ceylanicum]
MSEEVLVNGFVLTKSWLQDRIERKHGVRPHIGNVEPLGPDAVGYMSVIRRVLLNWDGDQSELPKSVIVKIPNSTAANNTFESSGARIEDAGFLEKIVHGLETKFYRLMDKEKPKRLLVPTMYAAEDYDSEQPVIVMEDYCNCFSVDLMVGFSEKQLFVIAEQTADLQVFSIRNKRWITVLQKNEREWLSHMKVTIPSLTRSICQKLMEDMPEKLSCLKIFMENTIDKDPDWMGTIVNGYFTGEKPFVLIHGDMWSGQILWRNESTLAGIVDWQGAHRGSPVEDLLRIVSSSATVEMRRNILHPLLDFYYDKMKEQLGADMPFSREYLNRPYGTLESGMGQPLEVCANPLGVGDVIYEIDKHVGCQSDAECPYPLVCHLEYGDCGSSWQPDTSA